MSALRTKNPLLQQTASPASARACALFKVTSEKRGMAVPPPEEEERRSFEADDGSHTSDKDRRLTS